jgi:hypothetical protein
VDVTKAARDRGELIMRTVFLLLLALLGSVAGGDELLPADQPIEAAIDHYVDLRLTKENVSPAPEAPAENVLRRTMLDLAGRPPTMHESQAYATEAATDKRTQLVDRLLAAPAFVRHQANEFDALLMEGKGNLRQYLSEAFTENKPWDRIFRELLLGIEGDAEQKRGPLQFVKSRASDIDRLTTDVSSLFFGVNVSCAKCHDHPLVLDWKQDHYYGMKSFFERTYLAGEFVGEKDYGLGKYKTTGGEEKTAKVMFLTGATIDEPTDRKLTDDEKKAEKQQLEELKKNKQPPPAPSYSRRAKLVETALQPAESSYFARAIVNHVWNRFFGRGLVMPVDQMHSENPASHPDLLAWLARDMQSHGYDLKRLIRGIVLSKAYARSSRWDSSAARPADELFAVAIVRPLSPIQYGASLRLATMNPDEFPLTMPADELDRRMQQVEGAGRGLTEKLEVPGADYQVSVDEALHFSNSDRVAKELLRNGKDTLLDKLQSIAAPADRADMAIRAVTARSPESAELETVRQFFEQRADRPDTACQQVVWSLLMSSELRFNY